jgi:hypothetical protein
MQSCRRSTFLAITVAIALLPLATAALGRAHALRKPAGSPPAAPSSCQAVGFAILQSATVTWTDNSDNEDGFVVEWYVNGYGLESRTTTAANTTVAYTGYAAGYHNKFRVKAFNAYGDSGWSNWAQIK